MMKLDDFAPLRTALEEKLGASLDVMSSDPVPVLASAQRSLDFSPLWALRWGNRGLVSVREQWVEPLQAVVNDLALDEFFSIFGAYELSKITLSDGVALWGPSMYYFGDERTLRPSLEAGAVQFEVEELRRSIDCEIFWHCSLDEALTGFGVVEAGEIVALAVVVPTFEQIWEIGMEVAPHAKGRGLGRAVVGAAGRWIVQNERRVMAMVAPWNIPSSRTLRSVGLNYVLMSMDTLTGHFHVPPQPLGHPRPGEALYNHYPNWAMNQDIRPKSDGTTP